MKSNLLTTLFSLLMLSASAQGLFEDGNWHRLAITDRNVYKLDKDYLEDELNWKLNNVDPTTIKIYGLAGGMLPQANAANYPTDAPEIAIHVEGESDGSFDDNDYILFWAEGSDQFEVDENGELVYANNLYADTAYYFITYGATKGKRISTITANSSSSQTISTFDQYYVYEEDKENILTSGRYWLSTPLTTAFGNTTSRSFEYDITGIQSSLSLDIRLIAASENPASFDLKINNNTIENIPTSAISESTYTNRGIEYLRNYDLNVSGTTLNFDIVFNEDRSNNKTSRGYFDYFIFNFEKELNTANIPLTFWNKNTANTTSTYSINSNNSNLLVWDISDDTSANKINLSSTSGSLNFTHQSDESIHEFVLFDPDDAIRPISSSTLSNQNIKENTAIDGLIVTTELLLNEAQELADFHESKDNLKVAVVTARQIYNEFSSGRQDLTAIRNYTKYLYEHGGQKLKYLLLFGDASYDYKHIKSSQADQNLVPVYESTNSLHKIWSHSSDDYYGFMENDEGEWDEGTQSNGIPNSSSWQDHTLEIGIGRITARTADEAQDVVNKIKRYSTSTRTYGNWKNKFIYLADDGDSAGHMEQSVELSEIFNESHPEIDHRMLFIDNFEQPGNTCPDLQQFLKNKISEGVFAIDYLGHGGDTKLMQESVITRQYISDLDNRHLLPIFLTATCQFGVYDDPNTTSGAEQFLLSPEGGAIAMITTTRAVYATSNKLVNSAFHNYLFARDENGEHYRLGDIMRLVKNNSLKGPYNRNFALLGDPMLTLKYPEHEILFDGMNVNDADTLSALEQVTVSGYIAQDSSIVSSFDGTVTVTIWDNPKSKTTLGLDNPALNGLSGETNNPFTYSEQDNALFRGQATVTDGKFSISFIVPKNTSYQYLNGKCNAYAISNDNTTDATGGTTGLVLGGSENAEEDITPPSISIYLNDESFQSGDVVGSSSMLFAKLFDTSGINISNNGFNQEMTLILNDTVSYELNDYYTADVDTYQYGTIAFPLEDLPTGTYSGKLKVWDTHNNYSTSTVEFKVSDKPKIKLYNVTNYPNPMPQNSMINFSFEHDRAGDGLEVSIILYNMMGQKMNHWTYDIDDATAKIDDLEQNALNQQGTPLDKGSYFYKLQVVSTVDGATNEAIGRLFIIN